MKIKRDFITNSSSSSFIVGFKEIPTSVEDVMKALFSESDVRQGLFHPYDEVLYTREEVAQTVFNDIQGGIASWEEILNELSHSIWIDIDWDKHRDADGKMDWESHNAEYEEKKAPIVAEVVSDHREEFKDTPVIYIVNYCDNDGAYNSALEHGDLFRNMVHTRISKH